MQASVESPDAGLVAAKKFAEPLPALVDARVKIKCEGS
jgi:hypothetical protein